VAQFNDQGQSSLVQWIQPRAGQLLCYRRCLKAEIQSFARSTKAQCAPPAVVVSTLTNSFPGLHEFDSSERSPSHFRQPRIVELQLLRFYAITTNDEDEDENNKNGDVDIEKIYGSRLGRSLDSPRPLVHAVLRVGSQG
jgi:hypothetical protein